MRRTLGRSSSVVALWLLAGAASLPAQADLMGATVTIAGYCCTAPTPADLFTNTPSGTVPVSFPVGSFISVTSRAIIPSSFDITANQIIQTSAASLRAATGSFNGVVYTFSGAPDIIDVTVDPMTTPSVVPTSLSFTTNSIFVNDAGLVTTVGAKQILDVTTSTGPPPPVTTPEPSTIALLGAALAGLAGFGVRRRRTLSRSALAAPVLAVALTIPVEQLAAAPTGFNNGDQVELDVYFPAITPPDLIAQGFATVGPGIEFPSVMALATPNLPANVTIADSSVNFGGNTITIQYPASAEGFKADVAPFNGFVFTDLTQVGSKITSVSLVTNILGLTAAALTPEFNSVALNLSGLQQPTLVPGFIQITAPLEPPPGKTLEEIKFYQSMAKAMVDTATKILSWNPLLDLASAALFADALEFQILALDPADSNYTVVPTPNPPSVPSAPEPSCVMSSSSVAYTDLVQNGAQLIGLAQAAQTAFNRATGAFNNNAFDFVQQQVNAGNTYTTQAEADVLNISSDLLSLSNSLPSTCGAKDISANDIATFQQNGFTADVISLLEDFGLNNDDIPQLTQLVQAEDPQLLAGIMPSGLANDAAILIAGDPLAAVPEPPSTVILCTFLFEMGILKAYVYRSRV